MRSSCWEQVEFALAEPYDQDVVLGGGSLNSIDVALLPDELR